MLAIGRALMSRPKLLALDEPSMGLAPIAAQKILEVIRDINSTGVTVPAGGAERPKRACAGAPRLCHGKRRSHALGEKRARCSPTRACAKPISARRAGIVWR